MSQVNAAVSRPPDHPDLPYKPPLAYLGAIAVGVGVHHWWPMHARSEGWLPLGVAIGVAIGVALVAIGIALLVWAQVVFRAKRTPLEPWKATKAIVDNGPFAWSRNPVYIAFAIIQIGIGVWSDKLAVVAMVLVPIAATAVLIVPREEMYLRRKFGAEYEDYCSRVRRWI